MTQRTESTDYVPSSCTCYPSVHDSTGLTSHIIGFVLMTLFSSVSYFVRKSIMKRRSQKIRILAFSISICEEGLLKASGTCLGLLGGFSIEDLFLPAFV